MKYKICFIYIALLFILISCSNESIDDKIFNGTIVPIVDKSTEIQKIKLDHIPLYGANYGYIAAHDSLMLFMNPKLGSHFFNIFHLYNGDDFGEFVNKGIGKDEFISVAPVYQLFKENGDIKTLLFAPNEEKLLFWNITHSLSMDTTIIDKNISCPWRTVNNGICYDKIFYISDTLYMKVPSFPIGDDDATLPYYKCYDLTTDSLIGAYHIYKQSVKNGDGYIIPESFYASHDAIKPDGSKIVQAMVNLPQLNILNLKTGDVVGYRFDGFEGYSIFKTNSKIKSYFIRIHVDNNYIYTVYWGKDKWGIKEIPYVNTIYIFDWHGNLVKKLETDLDIDNIYVNTTNNRLYVTRPKDDDVYSIDLTSVLIND